MTRTPSAPVTIPLTPAWLPSLPPVEPGLGLTIYGCELDEAALFRTMAPRFGVTVTITAAAVSKDNAGLASGCPCISVGHKTRVTNATLLALRDAGVSYLSTRSVGTDHVDLEYAARLGIQVDSVAYSPDGVADYTLMLMLMALRGANALGRRVDAHDFRLSEVRGRELRDLSVGVIGTGRIGAAVIARLRGFGCRVLAHDRRKTTPADYVSLEQLLSESDIVTLHAPLTAATRHLLDRSRIAQLKAGALVVNTARGALIDTEALVEALETGRLGAVALDVVEGDEAIFYSDFRNRALEHPALERLLALPNAIVSPHTAYFTDRALRDTIENTLVGCREFAGRLA